MTTITTTGTTTRNTVNGVTIASTDMKGGQIMSAHHQWANRPADETFTTLEDALAATIAWRRASRTAKIAIGDLRVTHDGDEVLLAGAKHHARLTHHAFGQIANRAGAPASYLRKLSAPTVALALNEGLTQRAAKRGDDSSDDSLLLRVGDAGLTAHALTSSVYKRLWNHECIETLLAFQQRNPAWQSPVAYRSAARVSGTGTGSATWGADDGSRLPSIWASDHDMFVMLTDQEHTVEKRDADGGMTRLFRGVIVENSEVGASSFRATFFLYDAVCGNFIIWGVRDVHVVSLRHVGSIREAVLGDGTVGRAIAAFSNRSASEDAARIASAQRMLVADTQAEVVSTLLGRRIGGLTETALEAAYTIASETPRYGDPRTVWAMVNGLTEYSQRTSYADERVALDRAAGKVLEIAF